jgi:hypothetical protein
LNPRASLLPTLLPVLNSLFASFRCLRFLSLLPDLTFFALFTGARGRQGDQQALLHLPLRPET